jgi:hypothetical protein
MEPAVVAALAAALGSMISASASIAAIAEQVRHRLEKVVESV